LNKQEYKDKKAVKKRHIKKDEARKLLSGFL